MASLTDPLTGESSGAGTLAGLAVTTGFDTSLRRSTLNATLNSVNLLSHGFAYEATTGRLSTVTDGINVATYYWLANSDVIYYFTSSQKKGVKL